MMTTARTTFTRTTVAALGLLVLIGCSADESTDDAGTAAVEIAEAPSTGPYDVGDTIPTAEPFPHEARREVAERLAMEHDRDFVWVTDAYTVGEGREVVEAYYAVDGTGAIHEHLAAEWASFEEPNEALAYAEDVVAEVDEPERYEVVPFSTGR